MTDSPRIQTNPDHAELQRGGCVTPLLLALLCCLTPGPASADNPVEQPAISLYASAACQPCSHWAQQLRNTGFVVTLEEKETILLRKLKRWLNVPSQYETVQTARVAGYFLEGAVPADDVMRLLKEKPIARGLVTTLPTDGNTAPATFDTLLVGPDGGISIFTHH